MISKEERLSWALLAHLMSSPILRLPTTSVNFHLGDVKGGHTFSRPSHCVIILCLMSKALVRRTMLRFRGSYNLTFLLSLFASEWSRHLVPLVVGGRMLAARIGCLRSSP